MTDPDLKPGLRVLVTEFGEDPSDALDRYFRLEKMMPPSPGDLQGHDVIIAIRSAAVGWVDLLMSSGQYQHMPSPPYCPGLEYSGVVVWLGPEVPPDRLSLGDRVLVDGLYAGPRSPGPYQKYGGFASYGVAPWHAVYPIPGGLTFDRTCNLLGSYETAYHCLVTRANLQPGETILIHGASGATGLAAVHLAKILEARVIATGRSDQKLAAVRAQGADHVINILPPEGSSGIRSFREEVKTLTAGQGVDVVYDAVGGEISAESLRSMAFGGRFLIVGWAATPGVARGKGQRGAPNANTLPTNLIMMKGLNVLGCPMVISTLKDPALRPPRLARILKWVEEGRIQPHVSQVFALPEFREALKARWEGRILGGCVLRPDL